MSEHTIVGEAAGGGTFVPEQVQRTDSVVVDVVTSVAGFDALEHEWNQLLEQSEARIYQTYEWQRVWWRHFGEGRSSMSLHLVLVRERGELIGLAPLCVETVPAVWPLTYRLMTFTGRGPSDYLDIIACRGREATVASLVASHLASSAEPFDVLLLDDIRETSPSGAVLFEALRSRSVPGSRFVSEVCPRLAMGDSFEATADRFSRSKRVRLLKNRKALSEESGVHFEEITEASEVAGAMDEFIRIHQARWNNVGHQGVFADPVADRFHREVVHALFARGWLLLAFLRVGGERRAGDYGLIFRDEFMTYLGGARGDEQFLRQSPGKVLLMEIMARTIPRGVRVFDFMRGNERYKYEFGGVDVNNWSILMFRRGGKVLPALHRTALLRVALGRRMRHEWVHLVYHAQKHGVLSAGFARYVVTRFATVVDDGRQKVRAPEKTVIMGKAEV